MEEKLWEVLYCFTISYVLLFKLSLNSLSLAPQKNTPKPKKKKKKNPSENEFLVQALAYEIALVLTTQLEIVHDFIPCYY